MRHAQVGVLIDKSLLAIDENDGADWKDGMVE
jgi:hypothetical protein